MIKFEELTLGEVEEIEMLLGASLEQAFADGTPKGRALRVLYFVMKRKEQPDYKFEDTENVTQQEALSLLSGDEAKKE